MYITSFFLYCTLILEWKIQLLGKFTYRKLLDYTKFQKLLCQKIKFSALKLMFLDYDCTFSIQKCK